MGNEAVKGKAAQWPYCSETKWLKVLIGLRKELIYITDAYVGTDVKCEELLGYPWNKSWMFRLWLMAPKWEGRISHGLSEAVEKAAMVLIKI